MTYTVSSWTLNSTIPYHTILLLQLVWVRSIAVRCWTYNQQVTGSNPGCPAVECNPEQVNAHVPLPPSSIIWYQPMGGDALRLGRSGVALAMRHRQYHSGIITYGLLALEREMSTPPIPSGSMAHFILPYR